MDKKECERLEQLGPIPGIQGIADALKWAIGRYDIHSSQRDRRKQLAVMLELASILMGHLAFATILDDRVSEIVRETNKRKLKP